MISVEDLIGWARENAVGRSANYPQGWIRGDDLLALAAMTKDIEPQDYRFSMRSNMPKMESFTLAEQSILAKAMDRRSITTGFNLNEMMEGNDGSA